MSVRVPLSRDPTAQAFVSDVAATPLRPSAEAPTFGLFWTAQAVPFQRSMSVRVPFSYDPTAQAFVAADGATLVSKSLAVPAFGLVWIFHEVPFQCSTSVRVRPRVLANEPTAQAFEAETAVTPLRVLAPVPKFGLV
jgi:hypothetical protein